MAKQTGPGDGRPSKRGRPANAAEPTREKLLAAAAELFNVDGYFGTNTNKIARAAGFAPATFYKHFPDKKAIFVEAYSRWIGGDWEIIEGAASKGGSARKVAREIMSALLERHASWVTFRLSMHALVASDESVRADYQAARNLQLDRLASLLNGRGAPALSRADLLFRFLCIERTLNAATDGDLSAAGVEEERFCARVEDAFARLLSPRRRPG